jgi:hypothetical protein
VDDWKVAEMIQHDAEIVSPIYAGVNIQNEFIAFWKRDDDTLVFFTPYDFHVKYYHVVINEWPTIRDNYDQREAVFRLHDDIINAAWHFIGQRGIMLNKNSFKISSMQAGTFYRRIWRGRYGRNDLTTYNPIDPFRVY